MNVMAMHEADYDGAFTNSCPPQSSRNATAQSRRRRRSPKPRIKLLLCTMENKSYLKMTAWSRDSKPLKSPDFQNSMNEDGSHIRLHHVERRDCLLTGRSQQHAQPQFHHADAGSLLRDPAGRR